MPLKLGLLVPANNTTMERELLCWMPQGSTCRTIKIPRGEGLLTRETVPAYKAQGVSAAASFRDDDVDAVVYGCTAAGFIMGPQADATLAEELAHVTGKPVVTTARSMVLALEESNAKSIAVVTPYTAEVNRQLMAFLAESGISVKRLSSFEAKTTEELGRIDADAVARLARETMAEDCDALFIACSQLPTFAVLDALQGEYARPVWSSIYATAWQTQRVVSTLTSS